MIRKAKKVTLQSLANELRVSRSTISRAFTRPELLNEETVERVLKLAKKRGYYPSISAKSLSTGKTGIYAVILPALNYILGDYLSKILFGIELVLDKHGFSILLSSYSEGLQDNFLLSKTLQRADIDGAFVFGRKFSEKQIKELKNPPVKVVCVDIKVDSAYCVYSDNYMVGYSMAEYMIEMGHKKIAVFAGTSDWVNADIRTKGIVSCLKKNEIIIDDEQIVQCRFNYGFLDAVQKFPKFINSLSKSKRPTAIIAGNDDIAAGIYRATQKLGMKIPDDVSLIGCDNNFYCDYLSPPLTSIDQNGYEIGVKAAEMLVGDIPLDKLSCQHKLIIRESVAKIG